jgi:hypothetical protein
MYTVNNGNANFDAMLNANVPVNPAPNTLGICTLTHRTLTWVGALLVGLQNSVAGLQNSVAGLQNSVAGLQNSVARLEMRDANRYPRSKNQISFQRRNN